ncbi:hypothetical protein D3C86_1986000 [compost metagenome]
MTAWSRDSHAGRTNVRDAAQILQLNFTPFFRKTAIHLKLSRHAEFEGIPQPADGGMNMRINKTRH